MSEVWNNCGYAILWLCSLTVFSLGFCSIYFSEGIVNETLTIKPTRVILGLVLMVIALGVAHAALDLKYFGHIYVEHLL